MSTVREPLLREVLGGVIKHHRGAEGLTLREVCARAGVSPAHWSEVERGRKEVSSEVLAAMCRALDLTLAQVLAESSSALSSSALLVDTAPGVARESALYRRVVRPADPPLQAAAARRPSPAPRRRLAPGVRLRLPGPSVELSAAEPRAAAQPSA